MVSCRAFGVARSRYFLSAVLPRSLAVLSETACDSIFSTFVVSGLHEPRDVRHTTGSPLFTPPTLGEDGQSR
jgi:hypothetical protein